MAATTSIVNAKQSSSVEGVILVAFTAAATFGILEYCIPRLTNTMASEPLLEKWNSASASALLVEDSGSAVYRGKKSSVIVTSVGLSVYDYESKSHKETIAARDILGASLSEKNVLDVFSYPKASGGCCSLKSRGERGREVYSLDLSACGQQRNSELLDKVIHLSKIDGPTDSLTTGNRRKYLIFINPISGKGQALKIWKEICQRMFDDAQVSTEVVITTHANHATEYMQAVDYSLYSAVMIIGGDGLLSEVVQGIYKRADYNDVFKSLPLCPVPGGSGNGLSKSILFAADEEFSVENAVFVALKGRPSPLDLASVQTKTKSFNSFLMYGWGLISDIDIRSEPLRCLGEGRFYLAAVYFILKKKTYRGKLSMLLDSPDVSASSLILPPINEPLPVSDQWLVIEGDFVLIMVVNTTHCSSSMYSSPSTSMNSEAFTIMVAQDFSRIELIDMMIGFDTGEHVKCPKLKQYKAKAYRIEPQGDDGIHSLDGEVVEYGPIQGSILPGAAKIITTGTSISSSSNQTRNEGSSSDHV